MPSTFGKQLEEQQRHALGSESERLERERLRKQTREEEEARLWHTMPVKDAPAGYRIDEDAHVERSLFERSRVMNCVGALTRYRIIPFVRCPDVEYFARTSRCAQGAVVVGALRSYEQFGRLSPEKGLAALYGWMCRYNPTFKAFTHDEDSAAQAFRTGKAPGARRKAAVLLADSEIVAAEWVEIWNRRTAAQRAEERPDVNPAHDLDVKRVDTGRRGG